MPSQGAPAQTAILLVEDDQATREMCALLLRTEGFEVDVASGGRRALDLVMRRSYDLIVLDLRLPDLSGLEVLARLRTDAVTTPVLMLSGYGTVASVVTAMRLGVVDFREKPLVGDDLINAVRGALPGPASEPSSAASSHLDRLLASGGREADELAAVVRALAADETSITDFNVLARALCERFEDRDAAGTPAPIRARLMDAAVGRQPAAMPAVVRIFDAKVRGGAPVTRDELARELCITPRRLSQLFIEQTGCTFRFWRRAFRVRDALRRLTERDARVAQVAYAVGYEHATQLDRDFRGMIGCTPRAFRRLYERLARTANYSTELSSIRR